MVLSAVGILGGTLRAKTVCASARQKISSHYNIHSLYGLMESKATERYKQTLKNTYTTIQKLGVDNIFFYAFEMFFNVFYAHQGCIHLKNNVKTVIL